MSDVNIDHIEALVGPLPRRREWERWCEYGPPPADAVGARTACVHCYCGDNFERRQT